MNYKIKDGTSAKKIKMISLDVDGVLTDGGVYIGKDIELKKYNVQDGYAIKNFFRDEITIAFITGRNSESVSIRALELKVTEVHLGISNKVECQRQLNEKFGLSWEEVCFIGDDFPDLEVMQKCGMKMCPFNAVQEIKEVSDYISRNIGGNGAVRDIFNELKRLRESLDCSK